VNGEAVEIHSPEKAISLGIGMIHQHFMLMDNLSVLQNIIVGREPRRGLFIDSAAARKAISALVSEYGLDVDLDAKVYQISVGQKQRVEILKALYRGAKILIMDEPTAVLTPQEVDGLLVILRKLADQGCAIVFITHKLREIMMVSDRVTVMRKGEVTGVVRTADTNARELAHMMVGRDIETRLPRGIFSPGQSVLELSSVNAINVRGVRMLKDVSFAVRGGEIVGIAGVEGNGQTELIESVTGMMNIESGDIRMGGVSIRKTNVRKRRESGMSHIPEDRLKVGTAKDLSIMDNMILNRYYRKPYCRLGVMNRTMLRGFANKLCKRFDVAMSDVGYSLGTLSGGNMQKVVLAREIETEPQLFVAAQPTRGVDIGAIEFIHAEILALRDAGRAVLLISAELDEILALSDRILVLYEGEIVGEFDAASVDEKTLGLYMTGAKRQEKGGALREKTVR
jgi:simple sugar transport system ATP-binding protein